MIILLILPYANRLVLAVPGDATYYQCVSAPGVTYVCEDWYPMGTDLPTLTVIRYHDYHPCTNSAPTICGQSQMAAFTPTPPPYCFWPAPYAGEQVVGMAARCSPLTTWAGAGRGGTHALP